MVPACTVPPTTAGEEVTVPCVWNFHFTPCNCGTPAARVDTGVLRVATKHRSVFAQQRQAEQEQQENPAS